MSLLKAMLLTKATDRHLFKFIHFKLKSPLKSQNTATEKNPNKPNKTEHCIFLPLNYMILTRHTWVLNPVLGSPAEERHGTTGDRPSKGHKYMLDHSHEESPRDLRPFHLEEGIFMGTQSISVCTNI